MNQHSPILIIHHLFYQNHYFLQVLQSNLAITSKAFTKLFTFAFAAIGLFSSITHFKYHYLFTFTLGCCCRYRQAQNYHSMNLFCFCL